MIDLRQGDCLEVMKSIPDGSVDLILTDLPYGTTACSWDEIIPLDEMWAEINRIVRPNAMIVMTASQPFTTKLIHSNMGNFSHQWIWEKEQGSNPLLANKIPMKNFEDVVVFNSCGYDVLNKNPLRDYFAQVLEFIGLNLKQINEQLGHRRAEHCFYINSTQFGLCTEAVYNELINTYGIDSMNGFRLYKNLKEADVAFSVSSLRTYNPQMEQGSNYVSGGGYIKHLDNHVKGGNKSNKRYPKSIIKFNTDKRSSQHPTQKPVALMEYMINTYSNNGDTVADITMGSGTTGVACVNTNRRFIGIELDKDYFAIAEKRINDARLENGH